MKNLRTFLKGKAMSNFICPTCGFKNIDCGKDGYKTDREIELEKKLEIAVKALKKIRNAKCYYPQEYDMQICQYYTYDERNSPVLISQKALEDLNENT